MPNTKTLISSLILIVILALSFELKANPDSIAVLKTFALKAGIYNMASIDKTYSPFIYDGQSIVFGIGWGKEMPKRSRHTLMHYSYIKRNALSLNKIPVSYPADHFLVVRNSFIFEVMDYFRYMIYDLPEHGFDIKFSGLWFTTINVISNSGGVPELIQSGLAPGFMLRKQSGRHIFKSEVHTPLIAWTVRNNYSMSMPQTYEKLSKLAFIRQNMMLQTLISNPGVLAAFTYSYRLSNSFTVEGNYFFRYHINRKPHDLQSASGIYTISFILNRSK